MDLQRLADSPLLLDGFEEFIRHWLDHPDPSAVPEPSGEVKAWLEVLPAEVTQYWLMVHRWTEAHLYETVDLIGNEKL